MEVRQISTIGRFGMFEKDEYWLGSRRGWAKNEMSVLPLH